MDQHAASRYAELVQTAEKHQARRAVGRARGNEGTSGGPEGDRWQACAGRLREDPFREDETLSALLSFIEPNDVVLDVGGGAGRYLPIAFRCREYVNVEPSPSMGAQFTASVREAGAANARWVQSDWLSADVTGDVCFCANVVYYIADIAPFVAKLDAASRRRVMIVMHSSPPRNIGTALYRIVHGAEPIRDPGYQELLPVLWELGILPEVRVLGPSDFVAERERYAHREAAIAAVIPAGFDDAARARARAALNEHFDELFMPATSGGYRRRPDHASRVLLITWETGRL